MADDKQTIDPKEPIIPEAPAPDVAGSTPIPDLTGEEVAAPGQQAVAPPNHTDNVIPFGAAGGDFPSPEEDTREPWEKTQDELNAEQKKPRRGRPPKAAEQTGPEGDKKPEVKAPRKSRPPKADKADPGEAAPKRDKMSRSEKAAKKTATVKEEPPAPVPVEPPTPRDATRSEEPEQIVYLNLSELHAFKNHPFGVRDDAEMRALVESVRTGGVDQPAIVRPREDGGYEIIAGHRRQKASELAGYANMPCIIRNMSDDEAVLAMTDSNLRQRSGLLPSEKAQW